MFHFVVLETSYIEPIFYLRIIASVLIVSFCVLSLFQSTTAFENFMIHFSAMVTFHLELALYTDWICLHFRITLLKSVDLKLRLITMMVYTQSSILLSIFAMYVNATDTAIFSKSSAFHLYMRDVIIHLAYFADPLPIQDDHSKRCSCPYSHESLKKQLFKLCPGCACERYLG